MAVSDKKMLNTGKAAWKPIRFVMPATATGQTDLEVDSCIPGFAFEIVRVTARATAITATQSINVKIGTTTALASPLTVVAAVDTAATLATSKAARRGGAAEEINLEYTTNGAGVITNGRVTVWIRPFPMSDEAMPTAGV
jgi:hypothetical protein